MVWKVRRTNQATGSDQVAAPDYATGSEAWDAAYDNMGVFIKDIIRRSDFGDTENPPSNNAAFKIKVDYRTTTINFGFELRYDYPTGTPPNNPEGSWDTNSIRWTIEEI
jgi:hypothetical protein